MIEQMVATTLLLTILECVFWGFVVWQVLQAKSSRTGPYIGDEGGNKND